MILGIYFALCIQASQRAFQLGFAIFKATHGLVIQAKPMSTTSLETALILSLGSEIDVVAILYAKKQSLHANTHKHLHALFNITHKSDTKTFVPKHTFVYISGVKPWNIGLHFDRCFSIFPSTPFLVCL